MFFCNGCTSKLTERNSVAQAKTGTGKTLAFLIPTIQRMINDNPDLAYPGRVRASSTDIRAIIMSPTRELAEQIGEEARRLVAGTGIVVQTAVGGTQKSAMLMRTRQQGCHLLVATPGRLNDILSTPESRIAAPNLSALVLDEADRMLDVGFAGELREILRHLPDRSRVPRQTLLFSATVPKDVVSLARTYVDAKNFEFVQTVRADDTLTHEKVPQHIVSVAGYENIYPTMLELIQREMEAAQASSGEKMPFKALVFLPTTSFVQLTSAVFYNVSRNGTRLPRQYHIHSKLTQRARTTAADSFRAAESAILFSSDVTARGMDFPNVSHVIQIGVPPDRDQYIHRLGRTGRADKGGEGWSIIAKDELHAARNILTDLPIQRATGLASAEYDMSVADAADQPQAVKDISAAMQRAPRELMADAYMSFFGGASLGRNLQTTCDNLNNWAINGWGWEKPPAISEFNAAKRGLLRIRGMHIRTEKRAEERSYNQEKRTFNDSNDDFQQKFGESTQEYSSRPRHGSSGGFSGGGRGGGRSGGGGGFGRGGSNYGAGKGGFGSGRGSPRESGYRSDRQGRSGGSSGFQRNGRDRSGHEAESRSSF